MPKQSIAALDQVFHALADPTRRSVIHQLSQGHASVSELAKPFKMALPSFIQHLNVLEESGLIKSHKTGRVRTCEVETAALSAAEEWIVTQRAYWEDLLDALASYVEQDSE